jgi:glycosyltransferase involved in cell wall biosynthesis
MHILWISDSPTTPSGFGNVTRFLCGGLAKNGFQISILGWQKQGHASDWDGCRIFPVRRDPFGADVLLGYLQKLRPDVVVALADVWWLTFITHPLIKRFMTIAGIRWVLYYPIDGDTPEQRLPCSWVKMLQRVDVPVAMSRYGQAICRRCGVKAQYIPHGVDTRLFCPPADKAAAKKKFGYEGRFVILSDARNQPRKLLPRLLDIYQQFAADKNDVLLHLHCDPDDESARSPLYAYDIRSDLEHLGLIGKVHFTTGFRMRASEGLSLKELANVYAAADVHMLVSSGEGFGLPTLQAASAGVVPLATDYSANRELVSGHGIALPVERYITNEFGLRRALVDIPSAVDRLEKLYRDPMGLAEMARCGREFALTYDWENVIGMWVRLLRQETGGTLRLHSDLMHTVQLGSNQTGQPAEILDVVKGAIAGVPAGVRVTLKMTESRAGEVEQAIQAEAFQKGQELSLPVALQPVDQHLPRRRVGQVGLSPCEIPQFIALRRIFPRLTGWVIGVPLQKTDSSIDLGVMWLSEMIASQELARMIASSTLVLDTSGAMPQGVDRICAALHTPYLGESPYWSKPVPQSCSSDKALGEARHLLLDQGSAYALCRQAEQRLLALEGAGSLEMLRQGACLKQSSGAARAAGR